MLLCVCMTKRRAHAAGGACTSPSSQGEISAQDERWAEGKMERDARWSDGVAMSIAKVKLFLMLSGYLDD